MGSQRRRSWRERYRIGIFNNADIAFPIRDSFPKIKLVGLEAKINTFHWSFDAAQFRLRTRLCTRFSIDNLIHLYANMLV